MKRPVVMGLLLSAVLVVEARAQSMVSAGQPARPQSPASGQTQLTVTGCLQSGNSSGATSRATGAGGGFVLANVETIDPKRDGSAAASGAADPKCSGRQPVGDCVSCTRPFVVPASTPSDRQGRTVRTKPTFSSGVSARFVNR